MTTFAGKNILSMLWSSNDMVWAWTGNRSLATVSVFRTARSPDDRVATPLQPDPHPDDPRRIQRAHPSRRRKLKPLSNS